jgi:hypothetical protein
MSVRRRSKIARKIEAGEKMQKVRTCANKRWWVCSGVVNPGTGRRGCGRGSVHLQGGTWNISKERESIAFSSHVRLAQRDAVRSKPTASQIRSRAKLSSSSNYKPNAGACTGWRARVTLFLSLIWAKNTRNAATRSTRRTSERAAGRRANEIREHLYKRPPI